MEFHKSKYFKYYKNRIFSYRNGSIYRNCGCNSNLWGCYREVKVYSYFTEFIKNTYEFGSFTYRKPCKT